MTPEEMALAKANSLAEEIQRCAINMCHCIKIAYPKKRIFPVRDRLERVRRDKRKQAEINMILGPTMAAVHIASIMSKPIPRIFPGTENFKASLMINETGNEIVRLGTQIVHFPQGLSKPGFAGPLCSNNILPKEMFEQKPCDPNLGLTS
jgi:hypothetical protein